MHHPQLVRRSIIALVVLLSAIGLWQIPHAVAHMPTTVTVGQYDARWFDDVYAVEGQTLRYRWTMPTSTMRLPILTQGWVIGTVALQTGQTGAGAPLVSTLQTQAGQRVALPITQTPRRFAVLLAPVPWPTWHQAVTLTSPVQRVAGDNRNLGVVVTQLAVTATQLSTGMPYAVWMLVATWMLTLIVMRLLDSAWRHAVVMAYGVTLGAWSLCARSVVETLPHWHWLVAWLAICAVALLVMRITHLMVRDAQGHWVVPGMAVPVVCALAWWMLPLFQMVLVSDNIYIRYYTYQPWMGPVVLITLVLGAVLAWAQRGRVWPMPQIHLWVMLVGFVVVAVFHQLRLAAPMFRYSSSDFEVWVNAARQWASTGTLYSVEQAVANPFAAINKRPPFYIMLFTPFVGYDTKAVLDGFRWLNIGLFVATMALWVRMMRLHWLWWVLSIVLLSNFQGLYDTIAYGQNDVLLLWCFTLMLWTTRHGRDGWTGGIIAFLTLCKIYPAVLLLFFVIKRRWWVFWGFAIGMVLCNACAIAVFGWDIHVQYVTQVFPSIGGTTSWVENQTLAGFVARFYDDPFVMLRFTNTAVDDLTTVASALLLALACVVTLRDVGDDDSAFALQYALFLVLMVVAIPVAWMHYTATLMIVFWIVVWHYHLHHARVAQVAVVATSYALIAFGNFRSFNYPTHFGIVSMLIGSYKVYGMLLLLVVLMVTVWRMPASWAARWRADVHRIGALIRARRASQR